MDRRSFFRGIGIAAGALALGGGAEGARVIVSNKGRACGPTLSWLQPPAKRMYAVLSAGGRTWKEPMVWEGGVFKTRLLEGGFKVERVELNS